MDDISARYEQAKASNTPTVERRIYIGPDIDMQAIFTGDTVEWAGRRWRVTRENGHDMLRTTSRSRAAMAQGETTQVRLVTVGTMQVRKIDPGIVSARLAAEAAAMEAWTAAEAADRHDDSDPRSEQADHHAGRADYAAEGAAAARTAAEAAVSASEARRHAAEAIRLAEQVVSGG